MSNNWIGTNGNWFDAANWSDGIVPQGRTWDEPTISGTSKAPVEVTYSQSNANELTNGLDIGAHASLTITATGSGTVFSANGVTVESGGSLVIDTSSNVALGSATSTVNGALIINGNNAVSIGYPIQGSGSLVLNNSQLGSEATYVALGSSLNVTIENGSALYLNGPNAGASVTFGTGTVENDLYLSDWNQTVSTQIKNFNASSVISIEDGSNKPVSAALTENANGSYTLKIAFDQWGNGITLNNISLANGYQPGRYAVRDNSDGSYSVVPSAAATTCFLPGTRIRTERGEVAVEDLRIGDVLVTAHDSGAGLKPVVWIGIQNVRVLHNRPADEANYPVRIAADAIAPGIPARDLRVTAEHCLYLNGAMVPARMLVNGASIAYDHSATQFDIFHVETEQHSVILAEGLPTESYLDTGNRKNFAQTGTVAALRATAPRSWENDAAAPLTTDAAFVEPLYRALAARSAEVGLALPEPASRTAEPMLRLQTEDGTTLLPVDTTDGRITFAIPPRTARVMVVSRTARPADAFGPWLDDRRTLGVLLGDVVLREAGVSSPVGLEAIIEAGWWPTADAARWTDGAAILPLQRRHADGFARLTLSILAAPSYAVETETAQDAVANG